MSFDKHKWYTCMSSKLFSYIIVGVLLLAISPGIGQIAIAAEIDQLMEDLLSPDFGLAFQAQNALAELGEEVIPYLDNVLNSNRDPWNRVKAVNVLAQVGSEDAVKAFIVGIEDREAIVRDAVMGAVSKLDKDMRPTAAGYIMPYLIHDQLTMRAIAKELLTELDVSDAAIAASLVDVVVKNEGQQRHLALAELAKLGQDATGVVDELLALVDLDDQVNLEESLLVLEVITAIGDNEDSEVYSLLASLLLSADFDLRQAAIWGMLRLNLSGEEIVAPVVDWLESDVDQLLAVEILAQLAITQPAAVEVLMDLATNETVGTDVREQVAQALALRVPQLEWHINRGLIAVMRDEDVFLSWRLLGTEPADIGFDVYRDGQKINSEPIEAATNYLDQEGGPANTYYVKSVVDGMELTASEQVSVWAQNYLSIPLSIPPEGTTPVGERYRYTANDGSLGDLTGDGNYEIILKWDPTNAKDNAHDGYTGNVYIDAYTLTGEHLWRIDLGCNIRAGAHYTQFIVYDLDDDGRSEIVIKTADGTVDGLGNVIGDPDADYRSAQGRVLSGPEYLTVFDGATGAAITTIDYKPPRGNVGAWGDGYGNRVDRFLAGVAYLDGVTPSVIMARGYYTRTVLVAYNFIDNELQEVWTFDSNDSGMYTWAGQGNHQLSVADVDFDGRDEIIYGAMTVNHDGTGLYNTRLGHGDALHVADHDPDRAGFEVFGVHESVPHSAGINLRDARTGEVLWGIPTDYDVGRGVAANIDPNHRGSETWASRSVLMDVDGNEISRTVPPMNFAIWWDADLERELLDGTTISKYDWENDSMVTLLSPRDVAGNNGTKATPVLQADIFGDWREEVIWRSSDNTELRIYTTTDLTEYRLHTLMHDPMYRVAVAWQNVAYNQPPHPSFYIGSDMKPQTFNRGLIRSFLDKHDL